ncbi:MAG: putative peptidoglycan glycosyltransferase FtsW [Candidatus Dojkabacteria bacterium]
MFGFLRRKKKKATIYRAAPKKNNTKGEPSYPLLILTIILSLSGLLMIFSASAVIAYIYDEGDTFFFLKKQVLWIVIGSILALVLYFLPMSSLRKFSYILLTVSLCLLAYTIPEAIFHVDMPFVKTLNGATRWIDMGFFDLQPSELFKFAIILFTASYMTMSESTKKIIEKIIASKKNSEVWHFIYSIFFSILPIIAVGIGSILILLQRDLDTIVIIVLSFLVVYYIGGTTKLHTIMTQVVLFVSLIVGTLASVLEPYRRSRVNAFIQILLHGEPSEASKAGDSFQVWNGLIAIGSGGLFGVGYGESRLKLFFLQEAAYTDSIFAIIGEEFGLVGTLFVVFGFIYFLSQGLKIAKNAPDKFTSLLAVGFTSWIVIQAFLNIAANVALIPFGGIPLPFFTYGGSNTMMILMAVGILLNISRNKKIR